LRPPPLLLLFFHFIPFLAGLASPLPPIALFTSRDFQAQPAAVTSFVDEYGRGGGGGKEREGKEMAQPGTLFPFPQPYMH
jgi:hypothetical protein